MFDCQATSESNPFATLKSIPPPHCFLNIFPFHKLSKYPQPVHIFTIHDEYVIHLSSPFSPLNLFLLCFQKP